MNKTLTRSAGFWLLIVVSLAAVGVGGWMIAGQVGTMTTTLVLVIAILVQVAVGVWQAREGLPPVLVGIHMVLASLSAATYTVVVLHLKRTASVVPAPAD